MNSIILIICVIVFCSGCASTSVFNSYTSQINPIIEDLKQNKGIDLNKEFKKKVRSQDRALYLMERGRIAQIKGDVYLSKQSYKEAQSVIQQMQNKAVFSSSGAAGQLSSILVNDNALPYRAEAYEKVMLYQYQAMNYLYQNDIEGAAVELRKANVEQEFSYKRHIEEINRVKEFSKIHHVSLDLPISVVNRYAKSDSMIGNQQDSFQNAYSFYLSGIVYEISGYDNDAYIDYKKALLIYPNNQYLQQDVIRLSKKLNMNEDFDYFKRIYPNQILNSFNKETEDYGELIVLFEDDFIPQKEEVKIPIPVSLENFNFIAAAFPIYNVDHINLFPLLVYENGKEIAKTEPICNLSAMALRALKEKIPAIVVHQIMRATSKAIFVKEIEKELGPLGSLAASAYNVFSENADLRSWTTLPATIQVLRIPLTMGDHQFSFLQNETGATAFVKVSILSNSKKIIRFVRAGNKLYYQNLT